MLNGGISDLLFGRTGPRGKTDGLVQTAASVADDRLVRGTEIVRGVLGSLLGSGRRR